jgi:hypothetical protein
LSLLSQRLEVSVEVRPTAIQKILIRGVIRCVVTATGFKLFGAMFELWMFVLAIVVLLIVLAAIVLWEAFR